MTYYTFEIVVEKEAEDVGYMAYSPTLPGCFSNGETIEEAKRNIREAIQEHLQSLLAHHQPIPQKKLSCACRRNSPLQCLDVTHAAGYGSGHRSIPEVSRVC